MNPASWQLSQWIVQHATATDDPATLLDGFCQALTKAGLPLWRVNVSTPAIDPTARSFGVTWMRDRGPTLVRTAHGPDYETDFRRSPIYRLIEDGRTFARWDLRALPPDDDIPVLQGLRSQGGTDYVLNMVTFAPGTALRGMGLSVCTNRLSGFSDQDLATLAEVLPALGLAISKLGLSQTLRDTLATYLGPATGARVLDGEIVRGQGQRMAAAILLVDLRAFTALTDRMDPVDVVGWLDEHFDVLGDPVARHGGEILKFLGDGFLAVFPVSDLDARPCAVCGGALAAAEEALAANRALNVRRRAAGLPALDADLVLHFGEVVYGNVGTSRRLDFTVIGRAVNEASRIEKLCGDIGRSLLMSESFAARCDRGLTQVGTVSLRGLEQPHRIWTVPD